MFTTQHYKAIAKVMAERRQVALGMGAASVPYLVAITSTAHELADMFKKDNSNFDPTKFLWACEQGVEDDPPPLHARILAHLAQATEPVDDARMMQAFPEVPYEEELRPTLNRLHLDGEITWVAFRGWRVKS